jgi:hypothetical protein
MRILIRGGRGLLALYSASIPRFTERENRRGSRQFGVEMKMVHGFYRGGIVRLHPFSACEVAVPIFTCPSLVAVTTGVPECNMVDRKSFKSYIAKRDLVPTPSIPAVLLSALHWHQLTYFYQSRFVNRSRERLQREISSTESSVNHLTARRAGR